MAKKAAEIWESRKGEGIQSTLRILILEDDPNDAEMVRDELDHAGLTFIANCVETEKSFLEALKTFSPDIILSDYDLPFYNGIQALEASRKQCPDVPFILVSGAIAEERAIEILTSGARDYVLKHRMERLVPAVQRALAEVKEHEARKKAEEELWEAHKSLERKVTERTAELQSEIEARKQADALLRRYNLRLEILSYTASRLLQSGDPRAIVEDLCLRVMAFLDCQTFLNFIMDEGQGALRLNAYAGISRDEVDRIRQLDSADAICGRNAQDGIPMIEEDIQGRSDERTALIRSFGVKAYACHPLMDQGRLIGTLSFGTKARTAFSDEDLEVMKAIADQVAVAISRLRLEELLRRNAELVEHAPVLVRNMNDEIILWNSGMENLYGFSKQEAMGVVSHALLQTEFPKPLSETLDSIRNAGQWKGELRHTRKDGSLVWVESLQLLHRDKNGNPSAIIEVNNDITERKRTEAALQESEKKVRAKLDSILLPEGDIGDLELADIIDVPAIQSSMEDFYRLARIPMTIEDLSGKILVGVGWQNICTNFHRVHPETRGHCIESDTVLSTDVPPGEFRLYKCRNNMWDIATPIMIGGRHVGNLFSGQFFFEDEPVDYELFRSQAKQYGFDEEAYLSAVKEVPRLDRSMLNTAMAFFMKLAEMLSKLSYSNIQLARSMAQLDALAASVMESREDLDRAQAVAKTGSWRLYLREDKITWSDEAYRIFGVSKGTPVTYEAFLAIVHPYDRDYVDRKWKAAVEGQEYDIEHRILVGRDTKWVREVAELDFDSRGELVAAFGTVQDITERKQAERELQMTVQRFHNALSGMYAAVILVGVDGLVEFANEAFCVFFGLKGSPAELSGLTSEEIQDRIKNAYRSPEEALTRVRDIVRLGVPVRGEEVELANGKTCLRDFIPIVIGGQVYGRLWHHLDITDRKQTEKALHESEERFRLALRNSPVSIAVQDYSLRYVWAYNQRTVPTEEILGKRDEDILTSEEAAHLGEIKRRVLEEDIELHEQVWLARPGGRIFLDVYFEPIHDESGRVIGVGSVSVNLTPIKLAEEALQESEEKYRLIFESSLSGILIAKPDGSIISANPAAGRILGMTEEDVVRAGILGIADESDARLGPSLQERDKKGRFLGELNFRKKGGKILPVEISSVLFRDQKGQIFSATAFQDISWRKRLEKVLMQSEQRFREMADAMPQLVWTTTREGSVDYLSHRKEEFFGFVRDYAGFWDWGPAIHPEDREATAGAWKHAVESGGVFQIEHRLKKSDGVYRWNLSRGLPVIDPEGAVSKWIGTTTDIHDLKEAERNLNARSRELEDANREMETFSYSVSHDLRAPLRHIDGFAAMLSKTAREKLDEQETRNLDIILDSAKRMNHLIDDLLSLSRLGRKELSWNVIDLDGLVRAVWQEQLLSHPTRAMKLKIGDLPQASGDRSLIRQVLINLLDNAIKFTGKRKKAEIEIGGEVKGDEVIYYVRDNGAGFDMKNSEKLFGVFQRLHSDSEYEGTGVGLAIVQRIIHRHGGRVWAEGKVGKGATFYFSLPIAG